MKHIPVSAAQTAIHRGRRKMSGSASNRKTAAFRAEQSSLRDNKGWDGL